MDPVHVIVAIDDDGCEALYLGGNLIETEGDTVYATDIADAVKDKVIQFSHVELDHSRHDHWPERFEDMLVSTVHSKAQLTRKQGSDGYGD